MSAPHTTFHDLTTVSLSGELTAENYAARRTELEKILADGNKYLALEMSDVSFVDSLGLSVLVTALKMARQRGGDVVLLRPTALVRSVLELTRLDLILRVFEDEKAARTALKEST